MTPRRRRPSSASSTTRPRRLAGQARPESAEPEDVDAQHPEDVDAPPPEPEPDPEPAAEAEPDQLVPLEEPEPGGIVGSRRTTQVLLVVIAVLAAASLAGGGFLLLRDDDGSEGRDAGGQGSSILQISPDDAQVAAAAAGQAAYTIIATTWQDYDAEVEEAAALMTPGFAEEYRQTAADVRDKIIDTRTEVQVSVISQGIVSANDTDVRVLVFLNMMATRNGKQPTLTQYRALVTVANTDEGWLVSDLETK